LGTNHIKPVSIVKGHHLTKQDKARREKLEQEKNTGQPMQPSELVKANRFALSEFKEVKEIYKAINQDDKIHERTINRYCLILADEKEFIERKIKLYEMLDQAKENYTNETLAPEAYLEAVDNLYKSIFTCERELKQTRKMLLDIEKSSCLTLVDKLRAIPLKEETKEPSKLERYMSERKG
jgi:hypothetical protein